MANTIRGYFSVQLWSGSRITFDSMASMIAAGSAYGYAVMPSGAGLASVAFPRAASLNAGPTYAYNWDSALFRSAATSLNWLADSTGTANASIGIPMFGADPKPIPYPGHLADFQAYGVGAGNLAMIFAEGDNLEL